MLSAVAPWLTDLAAYTVAFTVVITALGRLSRSRMGRWVTRGIREDFAASLTPTIEAAAEKIIAEMRPNSGSSFYDKIFGRMDDFQSQLNSLVARVERQEQTDNAARRGEIDRRKDEE